MKKIVSSVPSGGAPVFAQEMLHDVLTKEVWDAIEGIYGNWDFPKYSSGANKNLVLSGGMVTDLGSNVFNISEGLAYFATEGGIFAKFPAVTNWTPTGTGGPIYLNLLAPTVEQKTFYDAVDKDLFETYTAEIGLTAATDHVRTYKFPEQTVPTFPSPQVILDRIDAKINKIAGGLVTTYVALPTWNMQTTANADVVFTSSASGLDKNNIVSVSVIIRSDSGASRKQFSLLGSGTTIDGYWEVAESAGTDEFTVRSWRIAGGLFDTVDFSGTTVSRGYIKIDFIPDAGYIVPAL